MSHGDETMLTWRNMIPRIWATYRDGYVFSGFNQTTISVKKMFYPEWWLEKVGYFNPMNLNHDKNAILFADQPVVTSSGSSILAPLLAGLVIGLLIGNVWGQKKRDHDGYSFIPSSTESSL